MSLLDDLLTSAVKSSYEKNKTKKPSIWDAVQDPQFRQDIKQGLFDAANRGGVAGLLGGPVDLATMALRPFGYNVEKPVGGSEWIGQQLQDRGMVTGNRNPVAEGLASVLVPGAMTKAGKALFPIEQAAIQNAKIAGPLSDGKFATQRGVFGGLNAKTADKAKLAQAEQMLNKGVDPAQVWKETGWGRGPDGKWRFEIPDNKASLRDYQFTPMEAYKEATFKSAIGDGDHTRALGMRDYAGMSKKQLHDEYAKTGSDIVDAALSGDKELAKKLNADRQGLSDLLSQMGSRRYGPASSWLKHGDLGDAYPDVYKMHTRISPDDVGSAKAHYSRGNEFQGEQIVLGKKPMFDDEKSTMLHELQHAIQQREGFARGGSTEGMRSLVAERQQIADKFEQAKNQFMTETDPIAKNNALQEMSFYGLKLGKTPKVKNAEDAYLKLGGEAEARLVQSRMNLIPEERAAQYPWNPDYFKQQTGVGLDDLIHRFDGGEAKSVGFTYPQDAALETARQNGVKMLGLPENNTPMDRAKALGFDTDVYHGSPNFNGDGFSRFESGHRGASGNETAKIGTWVTDSPSTANDFAKIENAGTETRINPETGDLLRWEDGEPRRFWYDKTGGVLPLKVRGKDFTEFSSPAGGDPFEQFMDYRDKYAKYISGDSWRKHYVNTNPQEANAGLISDISAQGKKGAAIRGTGYDANDGQKIDQYVVTDPSAIRSRFAAFDPARINENDLLAGAMPFGLLLDPDNRAKLGVK